MPYVVDDCKAPVAWNSLKISWWLQNPYRPEKIETSYLEDVSRVKPMEKLPSSVRSEHATIKVLGRQDRKFYSVVWEPVPENGIWTVDNGVWRIQSDDGGWFETADLLGFLPAKKLAKQP